MLLLEDALKILDDMIDVLENWEFWEEARMDEAKGSPYYVFHKGRKEAYNHCLTAVYAGRNLLKSEVPE